ncbi:hypothetical protein [Paenibacillus koleovorans]|uniref:hypothetical protein n=1 Tax=Paenibacillus koleovorans TaxID=121608 RepID=UPI000FD711A3|nr:hypothetical protein [Paenibacillus koleovorans]
MGPLLLRSHRLRLTVSAALLFVVACAFSLVMPPAPAQAGFFDSVKGFFQLPGEVDRLQEQYDATKQRLDEAAKQLDNAAKDSKEALEQYKSLEQKLLQENDRLARQNEQLQQAILDLQQSEQERSLKYRRTITMIGTAAGLIVLYFVLGRVMRIVLRSR